jgi:hypothetical protein
MEPTPPWGLLEQQNAKNQDASAVKAAISFKDGRKLIINQFTSSPMKNMRFGGIWGMVMKQIMALNAVK